MNWINNVKQGWAAMSGKAPTGLSSTSQTSSGNTMGPWSGIAHWFVPRQVNPHLFESLREAIPIIDAGINRLVTMDGIIETEGDNDKLVTEIADWMDRIQVNDLQGGFQSFVTGLGNERYEQGLGLGEFVVDAKGRDIVQLRVADSKGINFRREGTQLDCYYQAPSARTVRGDGTDRVEEILRGTYGAMTTSALVSAGFKPLNLASCVYTSLHPEADNPYGTSIMRSMEFVARILLEIQNATSLTWNRLGDPPLNVVYKTKNRSLKAAELDARKTTIANNIAAVMRAKRSGNSAEFVNAIGADDDITITVIGAQDSVIELDVPARHMVDQITAKLGLPGWLLGVPSSSVQGQSEAQCNVILQESMTRWASTAPALTRIVETLLRLRGRTWKPGDWKLVQRLPSINDELKKAQSEFLRAQTVMMLAGAVPGDLPASTGGAGDPSKQLQSAIDRMSAKLMGMDLDTRRSLMADPSGVQRLIDEAMGW